MPSDHKRWFNSSTYSDTLLRVHYQPCDSDEPSSQPAAQPDNKTDPRTRLSSRSRSSTRGSSGAGPSSSVEGASPQQHVRTYHAHALVLREQSAYFDSHLSEVWHEQEQQRQQQQTKKQKQKARATPSSVPGAPAVLDVHLEPHEELEAMDLLLRFMYDHPLPAVTPDITPLLFQCLLLADRFDVPQCVSAILSTLKGSDAAAEANDAKLAISIDAAVLRHICHAPPGITDRPDFKAFHAAAKRYLVDTYGDVPAVIRSEQLRQEFCTLPFVAVLAWAESDELRVHSENCVVYLLSTWVQATQRVGGQWVSAEQLEQLAQQVRVLHLGPAYQQQILPQLGWFKGCSGMAHLPMLLALKGKDAAGRPVFPVEVVFPSEFWKFPCQWVAKARQQARVTDADIVLSWEVGAEQVEQMFEGKSVDSPPVYLNGFMLRMTVQASAAADGTNTLGLYVGVDPVQAEGAIPWPDTAAVRTGPVGLKVLHGPEGGAVCKMPNAVCLGMLIWGFSNVLSKSMPSVSDLLAPYLRDGKLHVEAKITMVDQP